MEHGIKYYIWDILTVRGRLYIYGGLLALLLLVFGGSWAYNSLEDAIVSHYHAKDAQAVKELQGAAQGIQTEIAVLQASKEQARKEEAEAQAGKLIAVEAKNKAIADTDAVLNKLEAVKGKKNVTADDLHKILEGIK
jgi:hypothetical protein